MDCAVALQVLLQIGISVGSITALSLSSLPAIHPLASGRQPVSAPQSFEGAQALSLTSGAFHPAAAQRHSRSAWNARHLAAGALAMASCGRADCNRGASDDVVGQAATAKGQPASRSGCGSDSSCSRDADRTRASEAWTPTHLYQLPRQAHRPGRKSARAYSTDAIANEPRLPVLPNLCIPSIPRLLTCGCTWIRTRDLSLIRAALNQLSYTPQSAVRIG